MLPPPPPNWLFRHVLIADLLTSIMKVSCTQRLSLSLKWSVLLMLPLPSMNEALAFVRRASSVRS